MKIAFFTDTFVPQTNGVVTSILNSTDRLARNGHKIMIFSPKIGKGLNLHKNIKVVELKSFNLLPKYKEMEVRIPTFIKVLKNIRNFNPDVIHIHTPFGIGYEGFLCSKLLKKPLVGTYHTLLPDFLKHVSLAGLEKKEQTKNLTWKYSNLFYNRCDMVITPSNIIKKELKKHGLNSRIEVVSNGVDLNKFYRKIIKNKKITILHVGRISYEKNVDVVLQAMKIVSLYNKIKFIIVGGGPDLEKLKKYAEGINLDVEFTGVIKNENLAGYYNKANIFVTASTIETEGIVILEAMACGLPIVGVNKLAIPEIVKNGKNGFVANENEPEDIAKYLIKLIKSKGLRNKLGRNSIKIARKYSLDNSVRKLENIYYSFLK